MLAAQLDVAIGGYEEQSSPRAFPGQKLEEEQ